MDGGNKDIWRNPELRTAPTKSEDGLSIRSEDLQLKSSMTPKSAAAVRHPPDCLVEQRFSALLLISRLSWPRYSLSNLVAAT